MKASREISYSCGNKICPYSACSATLLEYISVHVWSLAMNTNNGKKNLSILVCKCGVMFV